MSNDEYLTQSGNAITRKRPPKNRIDFQNIQELTWLLYLAFNVPNLVN